MVDQIPLQLGRYRRGRLLGKGGEGAVYEAMYGPKRVFALKVLSLGRMHVNTPELERHFQSEVQKLKLLDHPNIVRLVDYGIEKNYYYIVMPYIEDRSLGDLLKRGEHIPFQECLEYISQVALALNYIHQHGIVHRDVKPDNLLRGPQGTILLSDFGIASLDGLPLTRPTAGDERYMAPEQRQGKPCPASDQYALSRTSCHLLTGKLPEEGGWDILKSQSPRIAQVLLRACFDDYKLRYPTMGEFLDALNRARDAERTRPVPATPLPVTPLPTSTPASRRFSPRFILIFLLILALLIGWLGRGILDRQAFFFPKFSASPTPAPTPCFRLVTTLDDSGSGSLRQNVQDNHQGKNCIIAMKSSLIGTLVLRTPLVIDKNITIEAEDKSNITITPQNPLDSITISTGYNVSFQNISFAGLGPDHPAQLHSFIQVNGASVTFNGCEFNGFYTSSDGGAISNVYGHLTLENTAIRNNKSTGNGGAIYNLGAGSTVLITNSEVANNTSSYGGGGIFNQNGMVIINNTSLNNNQTQYNDGELEGGGALASWDGVVNIAENTTITSNHAGGSGGGLLLVGTVAQIVDTQIKNNDTEVVGKATYRLAGKGGGVAVETNVTSNRISSLEIINVLIHNNTNNYDTSGSTNDYSGDVADQHANVTEIISESATASPTNAHLLGVLTIDNFTQICQNLTNTRQTFTSAAPSTTDGGAIDCVAPDRTTAVSLVTLEGQSDMQSAVNAVCASLYQAQIQEKSVLARLFNYRDPLSWQCFVDEKQLVPSVSQNDITNYYCQKISPDPDVQAAKYPLNQDASSYTAYSWDCLIDASPHRVSMDTVCQHLNKDNPDVIAVLNPADFANPLGWQCWGPPA